MILTVCLIIKQDAVSLEMRSQGNHRLYGRWRKHLTPFIPIASQISHMKPGDQMSNHPIGAIMSFAEPRCPVCGAKPPDPLITLDVERIWDGERWIPELI
jgi:hypothetical protein